MAVPPLARSRAATLALVALVLVSCVNPGGGAPERTTTGIGGPSPTATPPPTPSPTPTPSPRIGPAVVQEVKAIVTGLAIPWAIDLAPDGRLFVTERPGRVRIVRFDGTNATVEPQPWASLGVAARPNDEDGLLGLALDPDFAKNGFVYLYYSYVSAGRIQNRVVRMRDADGAGVEEKVLLDGIAGSANHDGGRLKFGPDGKLYITNGDGEVDRRAQDPSSLNGKVLRINKDGTIPPENPIAGSPVWSLGHRNVQGIAWQPVSQRMFETEHGPSGIFPACCNDEVNSIFPGSNYGWPTVVGQARDPRFIDPVATSGRADTWAPSGATFLHHPGPLYGSFIFATLRGQHLHRMVFGSPVPDAITVVFEERLLENQYGRLRDVFELPSGQLLVLTNNRDGRGRPGPTDDRILLVTLD